MTFLSLNSVWSFVEKKKLRFLLLWHSIVSLSALNVIRQKHCARFECLQKYRKRFACGCRKEITSQVVACGVLEKKKNTHLANHRDLITNQTHTLGLVRSANGFIKHFTSVVQTSCDTQTCGTDAVLFFCFVLIWMRRKCASYQIWLNERKQQLTLRGRMRRIANGRLMKLRQFLHFELEFSENFEYKRGIEWCEWHLVVDGWYFEERTFVVKELWWLKSLITAAKFGTRMDL